MKTGLHYSFEPLGFEGLAFLTDHLGVDFHYARTDDWVCCTVTDDRQEIIGVLAIYPKSPGFDWHIAIAVDDPRCLASKAAKRAVFKAVFTRAARVTALIEPDNDAAIGAVETMGFIHEGFLRRGYDGHRDALLYGLLPEDCPYLADFDPALRSIVEGDKVEGHHNG